MSESHELSQEAILKIAKLARLSLGAEEVAFFQKRLGRVLGYVDELREVTGAESDGVVNHVPEDSVGLKQDEAAAFENREALMGNAPKQAGSLFVLPPVLEQS